MNQQQQQLNYLIKQNNRDALDEIKNGSKCMLNAPLMIFFCIGRRSFAHSLKER